jgi:hypothetical protein
MSRRRPNPERSGTTKTLIHRRSKRPPADPVTAVKLMPKGPVWRFEDYPAREGSLRYLSVGKSEDQDICIDQDEVSKLHCTLCYDHATATLEVLDCESKNGTHLWELCLRGASITVPSGMVIGVGDAELLVCGQAGDKQKSVVAGEDMAEFLHNAEALYGSGRRAAKALGVEPRTFTRWRKLKFPWR